MIKLTRSVEIRSVDVAATVAIGQERPEFLSIVQLTHDLGGTISPEQVNTELFQPLLLEACRLAIDRCVKLGLLEWRDHSVAGLSENGALAIETNKILVPEQGVWRFYLIDDPLIPQAMIHAERIQTETAFNNIKKGKERPEGFAGQEAPIPALLRNNVGQSAQRSLLDHQYMQLQEIGGKCRIAKTDTLTLELVWEDGAPAPIVRLTGKLPGSDERLEAVAEQADVLSGWGFEELWGELASAGTRITTDDLLRLKHQMGAPLIPVAFDSVAPESRKTFRKDVIVPKTRFLDLGDFNPTQLSQVAIVPETARDAQDWCEWLQWSQVGTYVTPELIQEQATDVLAKFPHHRPRPLDPNQMLERALTSRDNVARLILAPADLGLWS